MASTDCIGYLKYQGKIVEDGVLDARSAARALNGLDSALRYFIAQERPDLAAIEFPVPVRIQKGSWEAIIPKTLGDWIVTAAGIAATKYLASAAGKLAEKDFKDVGIRDVFKKALQGIQWLIRIGKHVGHLEVKNVTAGLKWDREGLVGLPNLKGEIIYVPQDEWKRLASCPVKLLSDLASVIEFERSLVIGVEEDGKMKTVEVSQRERYIFFESEDDTEVLFPDLKHGMSVELDGTVTRGNEMSNTIGFLYEQHILTCIPHMGNIVRFKKHLFLPCKISGVISRLDKKGSPTETRPKIVFSDLMILSDKAQPGLPFIGLDDEEGA